MQPAISNRSSVWSRSLSVYTLAAYAAILPFDRVSQTGLGNSVTKVVAFIAVIVLVGHIALRGRIPKLRREQVWALLFAGIAGMSLLWTLAPRATFSRLATLIQLLGLYLVGSSIEVDSRQIRIIALGLMLGAALASSVAIGAYVSGLQFRETGRLSLVLDELRQADPNLFAGSVLLPWVIALDDALRSRSPASWLAAILMTLSLVLSGSRGALVGAIVGAAVVAITRRQRAKAVACAAVLGLLIVAAVTVIPGSSAIMDRLTRDAVIQSRAAKRFDIYQAALVEALKRPFLGVGLDAGSFVLESYFGRPCGEHNIYLQMLLELGVIGLAAELCFLFSHLAAAWYGYRRRCAMNRTLVAGLVALFVLGASVGLLFEKYFWFALMFTVICVRSRPSPDMPSEVCRS